MNCTYAYPGEETTVAYVRVTQLAMNRNLGIEISVFVIIVIIGSTTYYYYRSQVLGRLATSFTAAGINLDKFGIKEIYSTKSGGEQWYFNTIDPNSDPRAGKAAGPSTNFIKRNDDGSWKVTSTEVRYGVTTSTGWHPELITTLNQQESSAKGIFSHIMIGRM